MTLAKKVLDAHEGSLNSLGEQPKAGASSKTKKKRKKAIIQVVENYVLDTKKMLKNLPKVKTLDKKYFQDHFAMQMIIDEIGNMAWEINASEAGKRQGRQMVNKANGDGYLKFVNLSTKSTFPAYLQRIYGNKGSKDKFFASLRKTSGKYFDEIAREAVVRLEHGYQNMHGHDAPNIDFMNLVANPIPF